MSNHPKHPKCPHCGRSMYKTMKKGQAVKKEDPWPYCRNEKCIAYGKKQVEGLTTDERIAKSEPGPVWVPPADAAKPEEAPESPKEAPEAPEEAPAKAKPAPKKSKKATKKPPKKPAAKKAPAKKAPAKKTKKALATKKPAEKPIKPEGAPVDETSDAWVKSAAKVEKHLEEDGPLVAQICDLAVKMVLEADGSEAALAFIEKYDLASKFDIGIPE